jgi:AraC-like DNA-binding protein
LHADERDDAPAKRPPPASIADAEPVLARQIVSELARREMDPAALLRGLGFGPAELESPDLRVSYAQIARLVRRVQQQLPQPHAGLRLGQACSVASWGLGLIGMLAAGDALEMLELAVGYLPSTDRFLALRSEVTAAEFVIVAEPRFADPDVSAFLIESTFAALAQLGRFVVGPTFGPRSVSLVPAAVADAALHDEVFGCPVHFGEAANRLVYPRRAVPIATADPLTARLCRQAFALRGGSERAASALEEAIVRALRADLHRPPPVRALAASLNLSERTLRRRLRASGLSYAALLDNERMHRAVALLAQADRSLPEVAELAGFTDARSLRRAIRRWTGRTPTQIRRGEA